MISGIMVIFEYGGHFEKNGGHFEHENIKFGFLDPKNPRNVLLHGHL